MQICETLATQATRNFGINNDDYGPWNNMGFVQWCVSEVQDEENVAVQMSVVGCGLVYEY